MARAATPTPPADRISTEKSDLYHPIEDSKDGRLIVVSYKAALLPYII